MKFIRPTRVLDSMLVSSTVAEDDHPAWNAATAYTVGDRVIRTETHRIYERLTDGTTATAPESDQTNWLDVAPTNRWAMFDEKLGTVTTQALSMTYVLEPGRFNSLAMLGVDAAQLDVTLEVDSEIVYSATFDLVDNSGVGDWYAYFYEPIYQQDSATLTDLVDAALLNVPVYGEGVLTVTLSRDAGDVSCALLVVGLVTDIGRTTYGAEVSIRDYSRKEADGFGNVQLVRRDYSKLMNASVVVDRSRTDFVAKELARYRATNVVVIGSDSYGSLVVYGFFQDWRLVAENQSASVLALSVEGMT